MESRFNRHSERLIERHGQKVWRLGLDAGFSCPHREGGRGRGGCSFCAPDAGRAAYQHDPGWDLPPLDVQVRRAVGFTRKRYDAHAFFLYFQAYSCTNLPVRELKPVYDQAIEALEEAAPGSFRGLVVSTRPDCFDEEKAQLLASYVHSGAEVWLELGLQSSHDETLKRINRGHTVQDYVEASSIAGRAGLRRAVHIILGLPGEGKKEMLETVAFVGRHGIEGIKFHDLRLAKGSSLARSYPSGEFSPLHPSRLPSLLADCIEILPLQVEIIRLCADFGRDAVIDVFPHPDKNRLYVAVEKELSRRGSRQGQGPGQRLGQRPGQEQRQELA